MRYEARGKALGFRGVDCSAVFRKEIIADTPLCFGAGYVLV